MNEMRAAVKVLMGLFSPTNIPFTLRTDLKSLAIDFINDTAYYSGHGVVIDLWRI